MPILPPVCTQISDLKATIAKLHQEATHRERVLGDRDKQFVAMRENAQKGDAARALLELRIRELQEEHEPVQENMLELKGMVEDLELALLKEGERSKKLEVRSRLQNSSPSRLNLLTIAPSPSHLTPQTASLLTL